LVRLGGAVNPSWWQYSRESASNVCFIREARSATRGNDVRVAEMGSGKRKSWDGRMRGNHKIDDESAHAWRPRLATPTGRRCCNLSRVRAPLPYCCWLPASLVRIVSRAFSPLVWPGSSLAARWQAQQSCAARLLHATRGQLVSAAAAPLLAVVLPRARVPNPGLHRSAGHPTTSHAVGRVNRSEQLCAWVLRVSLSILQSEAGIFVGPGWRCAVAVSQSVTPFRRQRCGDGSPCSSGPAPVIGRLLLPPRARTTLDLE
jgi:hypothetical protein